MNTSGNMKKPFSSPSNDHGPDVEEPDSRPGLRWALKASSYQPHSLVRIHSGGWLTATADTGIELAELTHIAHGPRPRSLGSLPMK
jgi:hypothetical protein